MNRQPGFYPIKVHDQWEIAQWVINSNSRAFWLRTGKRSEFQDSDFQKISKEPVNLLEHKNQDTNKSLESYILEQIKEVENKLEACETPECLQYRTGQKNILYQCLTAHDNNYKNLGNKL